MIYTVLFILIYDNTFVIWFLYVKYTYSIYCFSICTSKRNNASNLRIVFSLIFNPIYEYSTCTVLYYSLHAYLHNVTRSTRAGLQQGTAIHDEGRGAGQLRRAPLPGRYPLPCAPLSTPRCSISMLLTRLASFIRTRARTRT